MTFGNTLAYYKMVFLLFSLPVPAAASELEPLTSWIMMQLFYHCAHDPWQFSNDLNELLKNVRTRTSLHKRFHRPFLHSVRLICGLYYENIHNIKNTSRIVRMAIVSDAASCGVTYNHHSDTFGSVIYSPREQL